MRQDKIDLIADQSGSQILRDSDPNVELDIWMRCLEAADRRRQQFARNRLDGGDADVAAHQSAQLLDLRLDGFEFRDRLSRIGEKDLSGRGQAHAPWQALEQCRAHILFQVEICWFNAEDATLSASAALRIEPYRATAST